MKRKKNRLFLNKEEKLPEQIQWQRDIIREEWLETKKLTEQKNRGIRV